MSIEEIKEASFTAVELIGNVNTRISPLHREKIVPSINKSLVSLVKEDSDFPEAAPNRFGPEFSKRAKDFVDQVWTLRSSFQGKQDSVPKATFSEGPLLEEGNAHDKGRRPQSIQGKPNSPFTRVLRIELVQIVSISSAV